MLLAVDKPKSNCHASQNIWGGGAAIDKAVKVASKMENYTRYVAWNRLTTNDPDMEHGLRDPEIHHDNNPLPLPSSTLPTNF